MDRAALVAQPRNAIGRQQQRPVEIDDLGLVFPVEPVEIGKRPAGLVGAERNRTLHPSQRVVSVGRQRLLDQFDPEIELLYRIQRDTRIKGPSGMTRRVPFPYPYRTQGTERDDERGDGRLCSVV